MNKKILKRKINFLIRPITNYLLKSNHRRVNRYAMYYEKLKVQKNTILYESRDGNSLTDSPYAMFKYMLNAPEFDHFEHIWSVQDFNALSHVISEYESFPNVKFVKRNSKSYLRYLATCEYLINNSTFQSFFIPKSNQIYINTWHGTPLKNMGFDIPGNPSLSQNVIRNFLSADYLISPNSHTTKMFTDSYKLKGLYEGTIIEEGYPRIDLTLNTNSGELKNYLKKQGVKSAEDKENILYAPTWKGTSVSNINNDVLQIIADLDYLRSEIGDQYNILLKVHPFLYKEAVKHEEIKDQLIPDFVDTNELLAAVDLLITDYSSIFFDFLVTNKPILFYTWDVEVYGEERGQYLSHDDLPGPMVFNVKELADSIKNLEKVKTQYREKYENMKQAFTNYEDGKVTERIVRNIFHHTPERLNTISGSDSHKEKILIYPGGMKDNGITSSFINLMNNIDYDKYDVSCFTATPHSGEVLKNLDKINKNVRFLFKPGLPVYKIFEVYQDQLIHNRGVRGTLASNLYPEEAYIREHARLFGKTHFDYAIDFSGYSLFWAKYLVASDTKRKICFMHNDLLSDSERTVNGKRPHRVNLRGLFSIYNRFDKLVSVSEGTMEVNREKLSQYADYQKFDYVMNSISPDKILQMASRNSENTEKDEAVKDEKSIHTSNFKARAVITNYKDSLVWNTFAYHSNASRFRLEKKFDHAEIEISRMAEDERGTYYKFSHNNQFVGWINAEAVEILPDSIIEEKNVNRMAKLINPKGNHIFSEPYQIEGTQKVSNSWDYKDVVLEIDKEARTQHSVYSRILIKKTVIGWMDNSALHFFKSCAIDNTTNFIDQMKIKMKRKLIISRNYKKHKNFITNIENRTLREVNIKEMMFAKVTNPEDHIIWSKAYPNVNVKKIAEAAEFEGSIVKVKTIHKTRTGTYYLCYMDEKKIGWLDSKALETIEQPMIVNEREVSEIARIKLRESDKIWSRPYGLETAEPSLKNTNALNGSLVRIDWKVITQEGEYSHMIKNGLPLGWLDSRSLMIKEVLGIEVDDQFIPEPARENMNFVTMGRLSPEKGQDNLIHAFARFHREHENSKLYILGQGPLKKDLHLLIEELELEDSVHLLGQLENPFSFMDKCDCFVLSSHYEGQPMVLLEAMTLGMKIVATNIVANQTVLENGKYGLLVDDSIVGIEKGLFSMVDKENTHVKEAFDYNQYNDRAMASFYKSFQ